MIAVFNLCFASGFLYIFQPTANGECINLVGYLALDSRHLRKKYSNRPKEDCGYEKCDTLTSQNHDEIKNRPFKSKLHPNNSMLL